MVIRGVSRTPARARHRSRLLRAHGRHRTLALPHRASTPATNAKDGASNSGISIPRARAWCGSPTSRSIFRRIVARQLLPGYAFALERHDDRRELMVMRPSLSTGAVGKLWVLPVDIGTSGGTGPSSARMFGYRAASPTRTHGRLMPATMQLTSNSKAHLSAAQPNDQHPAGSARPHQGRMGIAAAGAPHDLAQAHPPL